MNPVLDAAASALLSLGLTADAATALALLLGFFSATSYYLAPARGEPMLFTASILLLASGALDAIDGAIARMSRGPSPLGAFIDSVADRVTEVVVLGAIVAAGLCSISWGFLAIASSLLVSYARARSESLGLSMEGVGLGERAERMVVLALATLFGAVELGVAFVAILATITFLQRVVYAIRKLPRSPTAKVEQVVDE